MTDGPVLQTRVISSDGPVLYLRVTAQFYLESIGKYILEVWGWADPKDAKRREAPSILSSKSKLQFLITFLLASLNIIWLQNDEMD